MAKKPISEIERGAGYFQGLVTAMMDVVREKAYPFAVIYRLATAGGRTTLVKIVELAYADWQAEQPQQPEVGQPQGGHPYRGGADPAAQEVRDIITVPDLSAAELVALARERARLTHLNPEFASYGFMRGECGKRFEVMTWAPGHDVSTAQVRAYFKERGFSGNTAAFISLVMERQPHGYHVSIPDEDAELFRDAYGSLCTPYFYRGGAYRELRLRDVGRVWDAHWVFVAFRAISS